MSKLNTHKQKNYVTKTALVDGVGEIFFTSIHRSVRREFKETQCCGQESVIILKSIFKQLNFPHNYSADLLSDLLFMLYNVGQVSCNWTGNIGL